MALEPPIGLPEPDKHQFNNWLHSAWAWITRRVAAAGTYGSATASARITVDADGIITAVSSVPISVSAPDPWASTSWQDVSGSRAKNTVYQNTTGHSIMVSVTVSVSSGVDNVECKFYCGPSGYVQVGGVKDTQGGTNRTASVSFIVPPNYYYKMEEASGLSFSFVWAELR